MGCCILLNLNWEKKTSRLPAAQARTFDQASSTTAKIGDRAYQRLGVSGDMLFCEYGFFNFNSDFLKINYQLPRKALQDYVSAYGYNDEEIRRLDREHQRSYNSAVSFARSHSLPQEKLNALLKNIDWQYKLNLKVYLADRGFKIQPGNIVLVDMPDLVKRNIPWLKRVAQAFERIAKQGNYDSAATIGAVTSLLQSALRYQVPPKVCAGINTGGILPPLESFLRGWGDCDTKTALLASILGNWELVRMVGISLPHHYLMAVRRSPQKGDMYVRYQGVDYVLIDPAGPAWMPPGLVGSATADYLQSDQGYAIEPFF